MKLSPKQQEQIDTESPWPVRDKYHAITAEPGAYLRRDTKMDDLYTPPARWTKGTIKGSLRCDGPDPSTLDGNGGRCRGCGGTKRLQASTFCEACAPKVTRFLRRLSELCGWQIPLGPPKSKGDQISHNQKKPNTILSLLAENGEMSTTTIRHAVDGLNSTQAVLYQMNKLLAAGKVARHQNENGHRGGYAWRLTTGGKNREHHS